MAFIRHYPDRAALLLLFGLWLLFFWRVYTPNTIDAVSLREGDFSAQFVSWTSYAADRWHGGELPLWNPYMNAGAPFLADPQTAVLYPPRMVTLTILAVGGDFSGGQVYQALQIEMTLHVLLGLVLMYAFLRVLTADDDQTYAVLASLFGAVMFGFGGYMNAYPQLQLPVLETSVWFPAVLLAVHFATRAATIQWRWLMGAGVLLAIGVLAGHPQTFVLMGYTAAGYLVYRLRHHHWRQIVLAMAVLGVVTAGIAAVQLLPTLEFQQSTYRQGFSMDDKSGGFAMQDVLQTIFPRLLGEWSPLYVGLISLALIGVAIGRRVESGLFWLGLGAVGLILSFGAKFALYQVFYVVLPGFSLFRGQERNVVLVVMAASVLATLGLVALGKEPFSHRERRYVTFGMIGLLILAGGFAVVLFFMRLMPPDGELYQIPLQTSIYALIMTAAGWAVLYQAGRHDTNRMLFLAGLVAVLIFDLFSVNLNNSNFDSLAASERLPEPDYIAVIQAHVAPGQHIEGLRGIRDSYGALYRVPDIWGNSPLRLDSVEYYLWQLPIERRWELLAVQVVNSEWEALPVASRSVGTGRDVEGVFTIYQLLEPRPFAHLVYVVRFADEDETQALLEDLSFSLRETILLHPDDQDTARDVNGGEGFATLVTFAPEYIEVQSISDAPAVLSLALPYTNGWRAEVDGESVEVLEAYDGLAAVVVPSGTHTVTLRYLPSSFVLGAGVSIITLLGVIVGFVVMVRRERTA